MTNSTPGLAVSTHWLRRHRRMLRKALSTPCPDDVIARALGLFMVAVALAAIVWAFAFETTTVPAPAFALGSEFLYRLERAIAATVLLGVPALFVAQLIAGRLPKSVGKGGIDWGEFPADREGRTTDASPTLGRSDESEARSSYRVITDTRGKASAGLLAEHQA
jgi:hypothetical protein